MSIQLKKILPKTLNHQITGDSNVLINSITFDSRNVEKGSCFFAVKGTQSDGHAYIEQAISKGASVIVCEDLPQNLNESTTYVKVKDSSYALGIMASEYYGNPSKKLKLVGVTGTNGKTTTATLLYKLISNFGIKAGLLSTVVNYIADKEIKATHTTPDQIELNNLLSQMVAEGCEYCFMEVSSHSIVQNRIAGLEFVGGIFTNITHDHLDYHKTFQNYINAKKMFFDNLPEHAFALTNVDDKNGMVMVQNTRAKVKTYGIKSLADVHCRIIESHFDGMLLNIDDVEVWTRLIGKFNAYNLLAIYGTLLSLGFDKTEILTRLSNVTAVSGRFEYVKSNGGITAIVDYAHTPDALENVLSTINNIKSDTQRVITVVGAGGNRDKTKRPEMAKVAVDNSDLVILTSDNPRFEEPEDILNDMKQGIPKESGKKVVTIVNRREAIRTACLLANPADIILLAGKGHETYQEIKGVKNHFDDKEEVKNMFNTLAI